jgi:pyridoxine/pyridoxamine 5'-phosphate oxidase
MGDADTARAIIDGGRYMTLGTADADGLPWVSPVWYAPAGYREFLWVSDPEARHSRNIAVRPQVAIVIFDSHHPGTDRAVYMSAVAQELTGDAVDAAIERYSGRSLEQGLPAWTRADVTEPANRRLYRAGASEHFVLGRGDRRIPVSLA